LAYDRPSSCALSLRKFGKTVFWLGSDAALYWIFDGEAREAHVGRNSNAKDPLGILNAIYIHPLDLIDLLGLDPIPSNAKSINRSNTTINGSSHLVTF